jgi:chemotaxis-related protein WspB
VLYILCELDGDRYAIDANSVTEVLPLIEITPVPRAPAAVAGICDRSGTLVPVVDLSRLLLGRPAAARHQTRLLICNYVDARGETRSVGLVAEKATEILRRDLNTFVASGVRNRRAPYLAEVVGDARGLVQRLDVQTILPDHIRDGLFGAEVH